MDARSINIQNLILLSQGEKEEIDEYELATEVERIYRSIKIAGIKNMEVCYQEEKGSIKTTMFWCLPEKTMAMAAFIFTLIYPYDINKIEKDFGLCMRIEEILNDIDISYEMTVKEFVEICK